jgi:hypothetical protein
MCTNGDRKVMAEYITPQLVQDGILGLNVNTAVT